MLFYNRTLRKLNEEDEDLRDDYSRTSHVYEYGL
jgi:hypothetical protein